MNKKILRGFLTIGIISLVFIYSVSLVMVKSPTGDITDFSDFTIYYDSTLVTSINSDTHISMIHDNEPSGFTWETYLYNFTNLGNFSNFYANITIDFEYTGSMLMEAGVQFGSNFFANGTYGGPNHLRRLFSGGIWDAWAGADGKYYVNAFPNDVKEQYESAHGNTTDEGIVVLHCNRTDDVVELKFTRMGYTQLSHTWSSDLSGPLNYMYLYMSIDPTNCTYSSVNYTSIYVEFEEEYTPPPTSPPPSTTPPSTPQTNIFGPAIYIVGLIVILNLTSIYIYRKRRR
jgi:hypothetical protein